MVCTANELSAWKDFPKGLRVLLLDEDTNSAAEIKSQLEAIDYIGKRLMNHCHFNMARPIALTLLYIKKHSYYAPIFVPFSVSLFCNVNDALSAVSGQPESFHVAIVQVSSSNSDARYMFLETAKELPTIMTSNFHCLSTMMKCIALGAVEFLKKPLSEDKLRNIWQHVVHKAFNAGGSVIPESLRPVKDSVASMIQLEVTCENNAAENIENMESMHLDCADDLRHSPANDKYPAPSTPQLKQGVRLLDDGDCQDHTGCLSEKESGEQEGDSKSVENTCRADEVAVDEGHPKRSSDMGIKTENEGTDGVKKEDNRLHPPKGDNHSCGTRVNRKKLKVDWTSDLHKKFVKAVEQLGVDQAIPSRILELMKVEGLTRHNVASHLQKHRRNILPKLDDGREKDGAKSNYYLQRPIMAYPPYHNFWHGPVHPMWGLTRYHPWTATENWHWMSYPAMHADAWGCPVMPPPPGAPLLQAPPKKYSPDIRTVFPAEEVIDQVVKEAINNPWLPLPLGLKPPSTDTVLAELSRRGISAVPPR